MVTMGTKKDIEHKGHIILTNIINVIPPQLDIALLSWGTLFFLNPQAPRINPITNTMITKSVREHITMLTIYLSKPTIIKDTLIVKP